MSSPVEAVPTLELPSDRLMQWSQMALMLATQLAARREQLDRDFNVRPPVGRQSAASFSDAAGGSA